MRGKLRDKRGGSKESGFKHEVLEQKRSTKRVLRPTIWTEEEDDDFDFELDLETEELEEEKEPVAQLPQKK
ncbi:hypothetical protein [Tengunoibacter tsumagoiensis]|uniref:Uncharacterized protein n=1 Tax=Tengunoibacter tsumagoiensis TaxID=2014871 RepID=A0A402A2K7_9CHLR|nr:hypothetical protein [Tengunoibacter tsumagoiensis]GCE13231.1 hypothetical protein KTT_30900 [Tengunoibacter tsumagoiensis]